jgi:hypothetical protein
MKYLVHLTSPCYIMEKSGEFRDKISDDVIDISSNDLHCTIMSIRINPMDQERVVKELRCVGADTDKFTVKLGRVKRFNGSLAIEVENSNKLDELHRKVVETLKGYIDRNEDPPEIPDELKNDTERVKTHKEYGSSFVMDFYRPHISVARVENCGFLINEGFEPCYFLGDTFEVNEFSLSRRDLEEWGALESFPLV